MDVRKLMDELDRLRAIVAAWKDTVPVERIERDIALEHIRKLYEEIRFAGGPDDGREPADRAEVVVAASDAAGASVPGGSSTVVPEADERPREIVPEAEPSDVFSVPATDGVVAENDASAFTDSAESVPQNVAGNPVASEQKLFDDGQVARIRMDKQVILSLYGDEPVVQPSSVSGSRMSVGTADTVSPEPVGTVVAAPDPTNRESVPVSVPGDVRRKVLGEVLASGGAAVNDVLGKQTVHEDVASRLHSSGIVGGLKQSIGINDKFMLIRNLFDGDGEAYADMIGRLDGFTDLDEALLFLQENYRWDSDNEGVQLLVDLLERKLG